MSLMLMDSALERIDQARFAAENHHLVAGAVRIVGELRSNLNVRDGGPLAANLDDLCEYMSRRLVAAHRHNEISTLDEVADLLREIRKNAWMVQSCMTAQIQ